VEAFLSRWDQIMAFLTIGRQHRDVPHAA
jgi:hypothetical protein